MSDKAYSFYDSLEEENDEVLKEYFKLIKLRNEQAKKLLELELKSETIFSDTYAEMAERYNKLEIQLKRIIYD